jgi:hypothetical protein
VGGREGTRGEGVGFRVGGRAVWSEAWLRMLAICGAQLTCAVF